MVFTCCFHLHRRCFLILFSCRLFFFPITFFVTYVEGAAGTFNFTDLGVEVKLPLGKTGSGITTLMSIGVGKLWWPIFVYPSLVERFLCFAGVFLLRHHWWCILGLLSTCSASSSFSSVCKSFLSFFFIFFAFLNGGIMMLGYMPFATKDSRQMACWMALLMVLAKQT